jgi:hypothetical protein
MRISGSVGLVVIFAGLFSSAAHAQWTVTYLHPAGAVDSFARGASGVDQGGQAFVGGNYHASRWTGSAASFVDMHPGGYVASRVSDTDGIKQVGGATPLFTEHAALWSGTAASFVDLHPVSDPLSSVAYDLGGAIQTGSVTFTATGPTHAALWSSTALSYVDIHPSGDNSIGFGTDGTSIVGQVSTVGAGGFTHAGLWKFGPDVFTDLHPAGAGTSVANDVDGAIQVGEANFAGSTHAALWTGTAASFVDMNPPGAGGSKLRGVDGGFQVGEAFVGPGASFKAGIWTGTAASFVNLHSFLTPFTFSSSDAWGVWSDGVNVYVAGSAFNDGTSRSEAVLWTMAIPEPSSLSAVAAAVGLVALRFRRRS